MFILIKQNIQRWDFSGIGSVVQVIIRARMLSPLLFCHLILLVLLFVLATLLTTRWLLVCKVLCPSWQRRPMTSIPLSPGRQKFIRFLKETYLCLIGSSCILWAPLDAIEAGDHGVVMVSSGPGHIGPGHAKEGSSSKGQQRNVGGGWCRIRGRQPWRIAEWLNGL